MTGGSGEVRPVTRKVKSQTMEVGTVGAYGDQESNDVRTAADSPATLRVMEAIGQCEKLPVLDNALRRVLELADRDEVTLGELVTAVEQDPGLTANILRFANSSAVPTVMPIRSMRQAVTFVGRQGLKRLALDSVAYRFFERASGNGGSSRGQMHLHAVQVSRLAVACADFAGIPSDAAHLAGLLHDCGKLVMPIAFGEEPLDQLSLRHPTGAERSRAERETLGIDHATAGALLASASGVDQEVIRAIDWHHGGDHGLACPDRVTACVQLADVVAHAMAGAPLDRELCEAALAVLGLPDEVLDELAQAGGGGSVTGGMADPGAGGVQTQVSELERLALTDDLTGLASRRHWLQSVRARLEAGEQGGVVLLDVDRFKDINDTYGHQVGDLVLCEVARVAGRLGFAGRLGGDELAIWVGDEPSATAEVAERAVRQIRDGEGTPTQVTVSAGTAITRGGATLSALLAAADEALYKAKRGGRNQVATTEMVVAG
jgi:diguanylate cyclase (GGDEF)-like protein/putative nucleotidyltransferase with HDIG domain